MATASVSNGHVAGSRNLSGFGHIARRLALAGVSVLFLSMPLAIASSSGPGEESALPQRWARGSEAAIVNAFAGVRIRATPAIDGWTLGALKTGESVRITEGPVNVRGELWIKVSWKDGRLKGWLPLRYLEPVGLLASVRT